MKREMIVESNKSAVHESPSNASLVRTLTELFGEAHDICRDIKRKQRPSEVDGKHRHRRLSRRRRESSSSSSDSSDSGRQKEQRGKEGRKSHGSGSDSDEEPLQSFGAIVRAEYEHGYHRHGEKFAIGDLLVQSQLQAQIIALQSTMLKTYQLRDRFPLAEHIFQLRQTSRSVRVASITALVGLDHRMTSATDHSQDTPHVPGAFPKPHHVAGHMNTVSVRTQFTVEGKSRSRSRSRRPKPEDEDSSAVSTQLFCPYALDLQQHLYQPLADAYRKDGDGRCPYCRFGLHTRSGKAWEVVLDDMRQRNRTKAFLIGNRFVVKCHREGGGLACVLCRRFKNHDTVCREIADLVDHIWREHEVEELEDDEDINVV